MNTSMKKIKIILTGAQGTGKSTLNEALRGRLSLEFPDIKFIDSISADFFDKEDFKDLQSDKYLSAQQRIYEFASGEYLSDGSYLSSRGFADSYAYLKYSLDKTGRSEFRELISLNFANNKKLINDSRYRIYTFYIPIEFEIESKDLRSTNIEFQKETDDNIRDFLEGSNTLYSTVRGTVQQRVNQVLRQLKLDIS